jgi:hypothetical protein
MGSKNSQNPTASTNCSFIPPNSEEQMTKVQKQTKSPTAKSDLPTLRRLRCSSCLPSACGPPCDADESGSLGSTVNSSPLTEQCHVVGHRRSPSQGAGMTSCWRLLVAYVDQYASLTWSLSSAFPDDGDRSGRRRRASSRYCAWFEEVSA